MEVETDNVRNNTVGTSSTPSHTTTSTQVEEEEILPLFMATLICAPILDESHRVPRDKYKLISAVHNLVVGHMGVDKTCDIVW